MLTPNELQVFLAVAEAQSYSAAARQLYLSQPAVSQQIQALERRLRVDLFEREGGRIVLTEAGKALVPLAQEMVNLATHIEESMAARRGVTSGTLRIGCTSTPGKYALPWLVGSFCQQYPQVHIAVEAVSRSSLLPRLQREELNFGLMSDRPDDPDLLCDELMEDELVLVVPTGHPFAAEGRATLAQVGQQTIILREQGSGTRVALLERLELAGFTPDDLRFAPMELGAAEGVIAAVEAGWGVSWVSKVAARRALELGKIAIVEVEGFSVRRKICMVRYRRRPETNAQRKFYEYVHSPAGQAILEHLGARSPAVADLPAEANG